MIGVMAYPYASKMAEHHSVGEDLPTEHDLDQIEEAGCLKALALDNLEQALREQQGRRGRQVQQVPQESLVMEMRQLGHLVGVSV
jgi:hypothetical protein